MEFSLSPMGSKEADRILSLIPRSAGKGCNDRKSQAEAPETPCISQSSPKKQNHQDVYIYSEGGIYFKELAHAIVEAGKCTICRVGWPLGDPEKN